MPLLRLIKQKNSFVNDLRRAARRLRLIVVTLPRMQPTVACLIRADS
jgi:hypothetical protein